MSGDAINVGFTLASVGGFTVAAAGVPAVIVGVGAAAAVTAIGYGLYQYISQKEVESEKKPDNFEPVNFEWQDIAANLEFTELDWSDLSDLSIKLDKSEIEVEWSNILMSIDFKNV